MANVNELLDWALIPAGLVVRIVFRAIAFVIRPVVALFRRHLAVSLPENDCEERKKRSVKR